MTGNNYKFKSMRLEDLNNQILKCEKCALCKTRKNVVPGEGSPQAEIMFIGEGPGKNEDEQGRPFVGAAGKAVRLAIATLYQKKLILAENGLINKLKLLSLK